MNTEPKPSLIQNTTLDPSQSHSGIEVFLDARSQEISRGIEITIGFFSKIGRTALGHIR